jgi:hypothetical protein
MIPWLWVMNPKQLQCLLDLRKSGEIFGRGQMFTAVSLDLAEPGMAWQEVSRSLFFWFRFFCQWPMQRTGDGCSLPWWSADLKHSRKQVLLGSSLCALDLWVESLLHYVELKSKRLWQSQSSRSFEIWADIPLSFFSKKTDLRWSCLKGFGLCSTWMYLACWSTGGTKVRQGN